MIIEEPKELCVLLIFMLLEIKIENGKNIYLFKISNDKPITY